MEEFNRNKYSGELCKHTFKKIENDQYMIAGLLNYEQFQNLPVLEHYVTSTGTDYFAFFCLGSALIYENSLSYPIYEAVFADHGNFGMCTIIASEEYIPIRDTYKTLGDILPYLEEVTSITQFYGD